MGQDKSLVRLGHETLLQRVCRQASEVTSQVVVVAAPDQSVQDVGEGINVLVDDIPGSGPLGGFLTGLQFLMKSSAPPDAVCLIACDTPFVSANHIKTISDHLRDFDAVVVEHGSRLNPLIAVYNTRVFPDVAASFASGERSPSQFLKQIKIRRLPCDEVSRTSQWLLNINTPADLTEAQATWDSSHES